MMERPPEPPARNSGKQTKVIRAAAVKPLNVLTLVAGLGISVTTLTWWIAILTLATYAMLVYLAAKDPVFERKVLEGKSAAPGRNVPRDIPPERRARWLPRGETREKVEDALVTYRKVIVAIEESDDVTRQVLEGSIPRLHESAERLVDVAANREKAAETLRDFEGRNTPSEDPQREGSLRQLESHIQKADEEISNISEQLLTLRAQAVRASMDSAGATERAAALNASLDELNFRLEALNETFSDSSPER